MDSIQDSSWNTFLASSHNLGDEVNTLRTDDNQPHLEIAKKLSHQYFRVARAQLRILSIDPDVIGELDTIIEGIFGLAENRANSEAFLPLTENLQIIIKKVSLLREYRFSDISFDASAPRASSITEQEEHLLATISDLVPSAARSYRQAILDSADTTRVSYRGPANEFREALRETLDYLAPDEDIMAQDGFQLEDGQKNPTRRQKIRYILTARKTPKSSAKIPEDLSELIDSKIAGIAGATYTLANVTAHIETERIEVLRVRRYILVVLSEILSIPE